ncbi:uncharacterized protein ACHE_30303S [Aspergillus chevalieri]|uniref:Uncharacterized protein n=1 Tax=Aspergillus chevalieri TaxID=182096 RepID=A0A7R7ZMB2_ASPCH|nr:uncharacterized protein ACHE_30303S [Aspergillus chevalieri]BCR86316.1 hypothetical protein ACHE_30303S [Aspergillus chevalieri]
MPESTGINVNSFFPFSLPTATQQKRSKYWIIYFQNALNNPKKKECTVKFSQLHPNAVPYQNDNPKQPNHIVSPFLSKKNKILKTGDESKEKEKISVVGAKAP